MPRTANPTSWPVAEWPLWWMHALHSHLRILAEEVKRSLIQDARPHEEVVAQKLSNTLTRHTQLYGEATAADVLKAAIAAQRDKGEPERVPSTLFHYGSSREASLRWAKTHDVGATPLVRGHELSGLARAAVVMEVDAYQNPLWRDINRSLLTVGIPSLWADRGVLWLAEDDLLLARFRA